METKEYLEYFKYYFQNLAQCRKEKIKSYLLENNICPVTTSENGMPIDNTKKNVFDFVMESFLQNKNAILLFQKYELFRNYKYSIFYNIKCNSISNLENILDEKKDSLFDIEKNIEKFNFYKDEKNSELKIDKAFYFKREEKIYIKIPIGIEKYEESIFQTFKTKMNFLCIIDLKTTTLEVRYDGLYSPFRTTQDFYLILENEVIKFLTTVFLLKLEPKNFDFIFKNIDDIKSQGFIVVRKESEFNDQGGARLSCNRKNMLPYVDDLKELLKHKLTQFEKNTFEYEIANEFSREIIQFINEKEEESNCRNIVLQIDNYRTHFNYVDSGEISCLIQHEYMDIKNDEGRGDYVREVILQLENKFNRVGNQKE